MKKLGISELLFTSDSPARTLDWGSISGGMYDNINETSSEFPIYCALVLKLICLIIVFQTANFQAGASK